MLHFSNKGQHTNEGKAGAMLNLKFGDRLELFYENFSKNGNAPDRYPFVSDRCEEMGLV